MKRRERTRQRRRRPSGRLERGATLGAWLIALALLTPMGCSTPHTVLAPIPLPVNLVKRATRTELEAMRAKQDWRAAYIAIIARDDAIESLVRDGHWERAE